ncbi:hypothetical protein BDQ94DRAFT_150119 [Aspergillus welwitschiae]|uniref:Uncharacterized protein n=1 Tax=Aspergillus welwitschiae TaxID=1341132 RepID=A0A3F3PTJ7_9EURO|nr:hypothetical protein BDQ94DRAFT_150119 [Aspergillus welwitschiae]RDH29626.1 hypothetical protein BDQ94DRAFT_150119 [Aspergillus welwitschiae]
MQHLSGGLRQSANYVPQLTRQNHLLGISLLKAVLRRAQGMLHSILSLLNTFEAPCSHRYCRRCTTNQSKLPLLKARFPLLAAAACRILWFCYLDFKRDSWR